MSITGGHESMNESIIDRTYVCLKLIDIALQEGPCQRGNLSECQANLSAKVNTFPASCQGYQASVRIIADSVVFRGILALSEQIRSHKGGRCYVQYVSVLIVPFFPGQTPAGQLYMAVPQQNTRPRSKPLQNQMQWYDDVARFIPSGMSSAATLTKALPEPRSISGMLLCR